MRTIFYFCLLVAATGFHGLDAMGPPPRPSGGPPRPSGRPPGPPAPPGNKGTTADYGWTDDDYDENEGWVSCGCHDAPSCRKCGTQQHLCNGDCSWSYGGCYRKGPRPTNPGPRPTRPPHPPTGETPVSMPSRPPPTWETPVSIPGSRPPPTYETPVHIGTSTPGPGGNGTSTEGPNDERSSTSCPIKCGIKKKGTRIVGGEEAEVNEYPWLAHLMMGCGGSVISDKWIVTAAHCLYSSSGRPTYVDSSTWSSITITIGEHDTSTKSETPLTKDIVPDKVIVHPAYDWQSNVNDIALLRVPDGSIDLNVYTPVCLPASGQQYVGKKGWVYGWGSLRDSPAEYPNKLQEVELAVMGDVDAAFQYVKQGNELTPDQLAVMLFAGGEDGKDSCQGDSGGPFTVPQDNGQHVLVGAVSWGLGCAVKGLPGAYADVSVFRNWIDAQISDNGGGNFGC